MKNKSLFVLRSKIAPCYARVDPTSGGYPSNEQYPWKATQWNIDNLYDIYSYIKTFPDYELVEVEIKCSVVRVYDILPVSSLKLVERGNHV
jgi:hypothetical protein